MGRCQSWTLEQKIDHFVGVVQVFLDRMDGRGYVSFSGGKDSTVMLFLIRKFIDNVTIIRPKLYEMFMNYQNNGVTYREALQYVGINFPDMKNRQLTLFDKI